MQISVVIPTLNEAETIGYLLQDLQPLRQAGHQVLVVDGGSQDKTMDIVSRYPEVACLGSRRSGRGFQMNMGANSATGDTLLFLHADTVLPSGGLFLINETLEQDGIVAGSFSLSFDKPSPMLKVLGFFSRMNHILFTYGDQGLFMKRSTFNMIEGFADLPLMEDIAIQKKLRRLGGFRKVQKPVITSARRFYANGIVRQQLLNTTLVMLYYLGMSPSKLSRYY